MQPTNLTMPRKTILALIRKSREHPTAADIINKLTEEGHHFAYATIYNSLKYLTEHGFIRELNLGSGVAHYDGRMEQHFHVVCKQCGVIDESDLDISGDWVDQMAAKTGYQIDEVHLYLIGTCPDCKQKT